MAAMSDLRIAWRTVSTHLTNFHSPPPSTFIPSLSLLQTHGHGLAISIFAGCQFETRIRNLTPILNSLTSSATPPIVRGAIAQVHTDFTFLRDLAYTLERTLSVRGLVRRLMLTGRAILEAGIGDGFQMAIYRALSQGNGEGEGMAEVLSGLMVFADESHVLCERLAELGFLRVVEEAVSWVVFEMIERMVEECAGGKVERRALPELWEMVDEFVVPWIGVVLPYPTVGESLHDQKGTDVVANGDVERGRQLRAWRKRLSFHLHICLGEVRMNQMLDLLQLFPGSLPALEDLKDCISSTNLKRGLMVALRDQFTGKMLNAGTLTSDILKQYVNMIRALRFLDPSDVILENVSAPVHEHLRRRADTIRCIVSDMTGDGELYQELERGRGKVVGGRDGDDVNMCQDDGRGLNRGMGSQDEDDCLSVDGDFDASLGFDEDMYNSWQPDPIDAPSRDGKWRSGGDAITTLVAIYGSSEEIVNEYRGMLADKLATHLQVDITREVRVLELLTERFGQVAMHDCDIMLKDFKDSVELGGELGAAMKRELKGFETTVISKEFWPTMVDEPGFKVMGMLEDRMKKFEEGYEEVKSPRKLLWQMSLGAVGVKLEFEDGRSMDVTVSPIQATILAFFGEKKRMSLQEICERIVTDDEGFVTRKIHGLASQGILRAVEGCEGVYETVENGGDAEVGIGGMEDDVGEVGDEGVGDEEAEMRVYQTYVMAMLQNLKQLPLEQIHSMLKRFVVTPVYDKSEGQLAAFLGKLVAEEKVEVSAGMYRVKN